MVHSDKYLHRLIMLTKIGQHLFNITVIFINESYLQGVKLNTGIATASIGHIIILTQQNEYTESIV